MRNTKFGILIGMLFMLASCVEEYQVPKEAAASYESQLVIEGRILSGDESIIYLSNSVPFGQVERPEAVLNADITIIGQNGYESSKAEFDIENDRYVIPTHDLPLNTLYALKVEVDGEIYQSDFQTIQPAKEIDNIYYKEGDNSISIYVSSHGDENDSNYYMWTYEEDWEFHVDIDITAPTQSHWMYNIAKMPGLVTGGKNPYYYCWSHDDSGLIHIYSTDNLSQNTIRDYKLLEIPLDDIRVSYIYSILVKQSGLNEANYEYFRIQKLYSEESGGLFAPMPAELKGNIQCISNPDNKVHGYVIASEVVSKRIFIYESELYQKDTFVGCTTAEGIESPTYDHYLTWTSIWKSEVYENGAAILNTEKNVLAPTSVLFHRSCVDCRAVEGATKKRPDFWPNNHE